MTPVFHDVLTDGINFIRLRPRDARPVNTWELNTHTHTHCSCTQRFAALSEGEDSTGCWSSDLKYTPCSRTHTGLKRRYLPDIFSELNKLNESLQVSSILNLYDKAGGFLKTAELWRRSSAQGEFTCFPQVEDVLSNEDVDRAPVKSVIVGHFTNFHSQGGYIYRAGSGEKPIYSVRSKWKQATCHLSGKGPGLVI